jgi:hypothetical protein
MEPGLGVARVSERPKMRFYALFSGVCTVLLAGSSVLSDQAARDGQFFKTWLVSKPAKVELGKTLLLLAIWIGLGFTSALTVRLVSQILAGCQSYHGSWPTPNPGARKSWLNSANGRDSRSHCPVTIRRINIAGKRLCSENHYFPGTFFCGWVTANRQRFARTNMSRICWRYSSRRRSKGNCRIF